MIQEAKEILETLESKKIKVPVISRYLVHLIEYSLASKYKNAVETEALYLMKPYANETTLVGIEELFPETIHYQLTEGITASVHLPTFLARLRKELCSQEVKPAVNEQPTPPPGLIRHEVATAGKPEIVSLPNLPIHQSDGTYFGETAPMH